jgi:hypothetical protein
VVAIQWPFLMVKGWFSSGKLVVSAGGAGEGAHAHEGELADALGLGEDGFLEKKNVEFSEKVL